MNYYLILTADVLSAKINANAKLLYAVISGLTNNKGYCYASNDYLAHQMQLQERQIQYLLKELKDNKLITINIYENNKRMILLNTNSHYTNKTSQHTNKTKETYSALDEFFKFYDN